MSSFSNARLLIKPIDQTAASQAEELQLRLTKPAGSLGRIETLGIQLSAISGVVPPPLPMPAAVAVFAGDHGVHAQGVTPWPQEVTTQMIGNFLNEGAAINVLARQIGASVTVVDVGVAGFLEPASGLLNRKVRLGTADLSIEAAMSHDEALSAIDVGLDVAKELIAGGARSLITGEMGIANTTASAAVIAALTKSPVREVTGRGTGIDDPTLQRKIAAIENGLARVGNDPEPLNVLVEVGGLEIAALVGFIIGGAIEQVPVMIDGVIANAALLIAAKLEPDVVEYCIAGHCSTEPGATAVLEHLGIKSVLDLGMRLGEGTGACLALNIVDAAARVMNEMATFDSAGVTDKGNA